MPAILTEVNEEDLKSRILKVGGGYFPMIEFLVSIIKGIKQRCNYDAIISEKKGEKLIRVETSFEK